MDAFFAAVEQRDFPELKGRPLIVGGQPDSRGVVATCSYEARKFGIHSAMASSRAYQLCPQAVFVRPRFSAYKQASEEIHKVFREYTEIIEPLSLDEAYLDVTGAVFCGGVATRMAEEIRRNIFQNTGLSASAGVSYNKFLAKLASDENKPDGQYVIKPGMAEPYLENMPVGRFYGVGKVTEAKMNALGIQTGGDLKQKSMPQLQQHFGNQAEYYYHISRGIDHRAVVVHRVRKSFGSETTFQQDLSDTHEMQKILLSLSEEVLVNLDQRQLLAYTFTIKIKYADFTQITRSYSGDSAVSAIHKIAEIVPVLLAKTEISKQKVRLLGVSFSNLLNQDDYYDSGQLTLF
ncbi:DNA polymerase IV [hydrothermal vent metagenome]|uniref:DNA-directed DNA polymerase n=1 Tax=hydrothermal vent metagenome TaxID=652676 RepID=A0A3B0XPV9_9ZZZZ